ncbi:MAG TPA: primosomal protein N' [Candidatus Paceibacterota bacterium]|nr:primosomal protein N' [Candidatus Paceibacterota bacterium]HRZ34476.1 primosomal protein N' [Candidatus Paceibacterota bacterium]
MHIVEVTPFSRSVRSSSLSYFSGQKVSPGAIVTIPLRNKLTKGLVIGCSEVKNLKSEIKSSRFALKKIRSISKNSLFSKEFISAAEKTAHYFATGTGTIIQSLIPEEVLKNVSRFQKDLGAKEKDKETGKDSRPKYILQTEDKDRYSEYKSIIREQFARGKSILFCAPTIEDANYAEEELARGIEKHTFVLHSKVSKNKMIERWKEITVRDRPSLVIATVGFVGVPLEKIGVIIVERESSASYKTRRRPYFDFRFFLEKYAEAMGVNYLLGDLMLRVETLWRYGQQEFLEHAPIKFRSVTDANQKIINLKDKNEIIAAEAAVSETLRKTLAESLKKNERVFLLSNRRGIAPIILCADCGTIVHCDRCSAPTVLHGKSLKERGNHLRCHACGLTRETDFVCKNCGGWRLNLLGIGIEKVENEIRKEFPGANLFILDKDHAETPEKARKIAAAFNESPAGILIGTEMALLYLHQQVERVGIISIDSMFALPDFRIKERILNILLRARALASQEFIIQTRNKEEILFKNIIEGNLTDFYRQEFIDRKKFNYPPFSIIIKLSLSAKTAAQIEKQFAEIIEALKPGELVTYPAFIETVRGQKIVHGMIKIPREEWPDKYLIHQLQNLPPQFKVQVDAESIL